MGGKVDIKAALVRCLESSGQHTAAAKLDTCGSWYMQTCPECGAEVQPKQERCRLRVCPDCMRFEVRKRYAVLLPTVKAISRKRGLWRLITLTLRNPGDRDPRRIRRQLQQCGRAVRKLWRNLLSKAGQSTGAIAGFEVGPSGNVHVHILHFGSYVPWKDLRKQWHRLTGSFVVDVRRCRGNDEAGLLKSVAEVTKYLCDPSKTDARLVAAINLAARGLRLYRTYGTLFDLTDDTYEHKHPTCPACLYNGPMNHGRALAAVEVGAIETGCAYVTFTGCRAPPLTLHHLLPGIFEPG